MENLHDKIRKIGIFEDLYCGVSHNITTNVSKKININELNNFLPRNLFIAVHKYTNTEK